MTPAHPVLVARELTVRRGRGRDAVTVLTNAEIAVSPGEIVGISGPSGSGKTSLLGVLSGELTAAAGTIEMRSGDTSGPPRKIRRTIPGSIALIAQDPVATLDSLWPIVRSVAEPLRAAGIARSEARRRAEAALDAVGLGHLGPDRHPHELSIGQAQRVCVARAFAGRPALLLADEATSALDVTSAAGVAALLRDAATDGVAVVMVSHDHRLLDSVSDRRLHLADGQLVAGRATGYRSMTVSAA